MHRDSEARTTLESSLKLANDVADWRSPSQSYFGSNNVNVGSGSGHNSSVGYSNYRPTALAIRDADQKMADIAKTPAVPAATPPGK